MYLGDKVNPKRAYGLSTLEGIVVVRIYDPFVRVHLVLKSTHASSGSGASVRLRLIQHARLAANS